MHISILVNVCSHPGNISNGKTEGTDFNQSAVIYYLCNNGFELDEASANLTCSVDGIWIGKKPECLR